MSTMAINFPPGSDTLAAGRHAGTIAEIEAALVDAFPGSATRRPLFDSWVAVREAISRVVSVSAEWIDGSYVTKKNDPNDIDIVTHIPGPELEALDPADQALLLGLVAARISQALHGCDSYVCAVYPPGHPNFPAYQAIAAYWDKWFGHDRNGQPKGYVEVTP